ncbi:MAG: hypothetical protein OES57_03800 [Acidimicrobiia bacterium]|nr:hypothetical protein [Acidimicrobiia bacterium]
MAPTDQPSASGPSPGAIPDRSTRERRADAHQRRAIARRLAQLEAEMLAAEDDAVEAGPGVSR